ncbi:allergen Fel d 4-like isoform X1 [Delphinus delphis]|uniref:allergen Fel d 4-like isoform X1 n=2 Tax=Delphinus delphis TaxID=9728 RepID=UPI0028C4BE66|nr:allergen Fel d 4-like isoform X1 [Delphinus delphis]XP_059870292.1 allergen Fel d 4-like isoform X1 [Delphinus delphis]
MRVFVEHIHALENFSLFFKFHTKVSGACTEMSLLSDKAGEDGVHSVTYDEDNKFRILQTNYTEYIIFYLMNVNNNEPFQLLELYDHCLQARGSGVAQASSSIREAPNESRCSCSRRLI